jgi:transcriptional regulator with XRE-family HTH domain
MPTQQHADSRALARETARQRMRELGLSYTLIATRTDITRQTVSAFLRGEVEWPQDATLTKIDRALEWPAGTLAGIAMGTAKAPGEPPAEMDGERRLAIGWPEDFGEDEAAEWEAAVRAAAFERARAIRASRRA